MIVNVCPSAIAAAPAERIWQVLTTPERFGEWLDTQVVAIRPRGPASSGQRIELAAFLFGLRLRVYIDVGAVDPERHWIQLRVRLPFGIVNHERSSTPAPTRPASRFQMLNWPPSNSRPPHSRATGIMPLPHMEPIKLLTDGSLASASI